MSSNLDPFMPAFDVRERFERRVNAPPDVVMQTAYDIDMQSIFLIWLIVRLRKFILGGTPDKREPKGIVQETRDLGWGTLVEETGKLLICGARCEPWFGDVTFTPIPADKFSVYNEPDQVKIVWSLEVTEIEPDTTILAHEVRALATDPEAKKQFQRYWRWARFGIIGIRLLLLPAIRRKAERKWRSDRHDDFGLYATQKDDDRTEWDAAWSAMPHRSILKWHDGLASTLAPNFGEIKKISVSLVPKQYIDKMFFSTTDCPICGRPMNDVNRLAGSLIVSFTKISSLGFGAWLHPECYETCQPIDETPRIPW